MFFPQLTSQHYFSICLTNSSLTKITGETFTSFKHLKPLVRLKWQRDSLSSVAFHVKRTTFFWHKFFWEIYACDQSLSG